MGRTAGGLVQKKYLQCTVAVMERTALAAFAWADSEPVQVLSTLLAFYPLVSLQTLVTLLRFAP
jgi:hypothetical protein